MILLGSIQRIELLRLLELQIGRERRLQEAAKRAQLSESPKTPRAEKKLSRFEVVPVVSSTRVSFFVCLFVFKFFYRKVLSYITLDVIYNFNHCIVTTILCNVTNYHNDQQCKIHCSSVKYELF